MTNLAICPKCRALTPDTDDDVATHRRKAHTEPAADLERARKAASDATTALTLLQAAVRDYEKALDQRPVAVEPELNMRVVEDVDDELDDLEPSEDEEDNEPATTYEDDTPAAPVTSLYSPRTDLNDYDPRPIA
jgi:hypothetical protein